MAGWLTPKAFFVAQAYDDAGLQAATLQLLLLVLMVSPPPKDFRLCIHEIHRLRVQCLRVTDLGIYFVTLSWFGIVFNCVVLGLYFVGFYSAYTRNRPLTL